MITSGKKLQIATLIIMIFVFIFLLARFLFILTIIMEGVADFSIWNLLGFLELPFIIAILAVTISILKKSKDISNHPLIDLTLAPITLLIIVEGIDSYLFTDDTIWGFYIGDFYLNLRMMLYIGMLGLTMMCTFLVRHAKKKKSYPLLKMRLIVTTLCLAAFVIGMFNIVTKDYHFAEPYFDFAHFQFENLFYLSQFAVTVLFMVMLVLILIAAINMLFDIQRDDYKKDKE